MQDLTDWQLSGSHVAKIAESDMVAEKDSLPADVAGYILKCKSVFRCRLCPRIVCLTEETLRAHLKSKVRHFVRMSLFSIMITLSIVLDGYCA